jgi:hypothetical protein
MSEVLQPDLNMIEGFLASCVPHPLFFLNSLLPWEVHAWLLMMHMCGILILLAAERFWQISIDQTSAIAYTTEGELYAIRKPGQ